MIESSTSEELIVVESTYGKKRRTVSKKHTNKKKVVDYADLHKLSEDDDCIILENTKQEQDIMIPPPNDYISCPDFLEFSSDELDRNMNCLNNTRDDQANEAHIAALDFISTFDNPCSIYKNLGKTYKSLGSEENNNFYSTYDGKDKSTCNSLSHIVDTKDVSDQKRKLPENLSKNQPVIAEELSTLKALAKELVTAKVSTGNVNKTNEILKQANTNSNNYTDPNNNHIQGDDRVASLQNGDGSQVSKKVVPSSNDYKYTLRFKCAGFEKDYLMNDEDPIEKIYYELFGENTERKILYEGMKLSRFLTAGDAGFFKGINYISLPANETLPFVKEMVVTIKTDESIENDIKVVIYPNYVVSDLYKHLESCGIKTKEFVLVMNGRALADGQRLQDIVEDGYSIDCVKSSLLEM